MFWCKIWNVKVVYPYQIGCALRLQQRLYCLWESLIRFTQMKYERQALGNYLDLKAVPLSHRSHVVRRWKFLRSSILAWSTLGLWQMRTNELCVFKRSSHTVSDLQVRLVLSFTEQSSFDCVIRHAQLLEPMQLPRIFKSGQMHLTRLPEASVLRPRTRLWQLNRSFPDSRAGQTYSRAMGKPKASKQVSPDEFPMSNIAK